MSVLTKLSLGHFGVETEAPNASLVSHRGARHTRPEPCGAIWPSMCECVVLTRFYCTLDIKLAWSLGQLHKRDVLSRNQPLLLWRVRLKGTNMRVVFKSRLLSRTYERTWFIWDSIPCDILQDARMSFRLI